MKAEGSSHNKYPRVGILFLFLVGVFFSGPLVFSQNYNRDAINQARFGNKARQNLLRQIYQIDKSINAEIYGQEIPVQALKSRLVQYIETWGSRTKEPVALHFVGLPGIGKSAIIFEIYKLKDAGLNIVRFDAQNYVGQKADNFRSELQNIIELEKIKGMPILLVVEELDKIPEIDIQTGREITHPLIGVLNEILSSGHVANGSKHTEYSNIMVMTTMNLSPKDISSFSSESLGEQKSFYNYSIEDLQVFHRWILNEPAALPKVLSSLFRANTVSRIAPNAVLFKPLDFVDYKEIARKTIRESIARNTSGKTAEQRLEVSFTEGFVDFVTAKSTYAPSGARNTIARTDTMTDQLIQFSKRASFEGDTSLNRPRKIHISYDESHDDIIVTVTPLIYKKGIIEQGHSWNFSVQYSTETGVFAQPENLVLEGPPTLHTAVIKEQKLSQKKIKAMRFPEVSSTSDNLELVLNKKIFGQADSIKTLSTEVNSYLTRPGPAELTPSSIVLAGFPGIGKSELLKITGEQMKLPIVRINLQQFSSNESNAVEKFIAAIHESTSNLYDKKYILLLEELDKIFELDPKTGAIVNRPVMALIKDLMNDGQIKSIDSKGIKTVVDVRGAFIAVTMNFAIDRFKFEADPRLTSLEDVMAAYKKLSTRLTDLKELLGTMFLPETVNRLIAKVKILKPLSKENYQDLILMEIESTVKARLYKDGKNLGQIWIEVSPEYKKYLFSETVIPSEGARNTVKAVRSIVSADLESALRAIPKSSPLAGKPLIIQLGYLPGSQKVKASIVSKDDPKLMVKNIFSRQVFLAFPSLEIKGLMKPERIRTAIHEFGHAFIAARLGLRFEYATVVPPKSGVGGYVKFTNAPRSATLIIADLYASLGSRAMERIFLSENPLSERSVGDITPGASGDIDSASKGIFNAIYALGFDPKGGVLFRGAVLGSGRSNFEDVPAEQIEKLGLILRDLEDKMVSDLLLAHSQDWYVEKITSFAKKGGLSEKAFYEIIGYDHPGESKDHHGEQSLIYKAFSKVILPKSKEVRNAGNTKASADGLTTEQRMRVFKSSFYDSVERHLHLSELERNSQKKVEVVPLPRPLVLKCEAIDL